MRLKLTQQDLKGIIMDRFKDPKDVIFRTDTDVTRDSSQIDREIVGVFEGCDVIFNNDKTARVHLDDSDVIGIIKDYVKNKGYSADDSDITLRMGTRTTGATPLDIKTIPVFNGVAVECQEISKDVPVKSDDKAQANDQNTPENNSRRSGEITFVSGLRRQEHVNSLCEMEDRDLCEMIRAHFESHPALPGEKDLKDTVNALLNTPDGEIKLDASKKADLARGYADARIKQTPVNMAGVHPEDLWLRKADPSETGITNSTIDVYMGKVELQRSESGRVYVLAEEKQADNSYQTIGSLSDKFLKNNPMNVDSCEADIQIVDYSNGKMKNISARVVADTDLMSGDVIDLDEDMLAGLDQESGLSQ